MRDSDFFFCDGAWRLPLFRIYRSAANVLSLVPLRLDYDLSAPSTIFSTHFFSYVVEDPGRIFGLLLSFSLLPPKPDGRPQL